MTEQEIQDVRAAWAADPKCFDGWILKPWEATGAGVAQVHMDLHLRLLELGAWVKVNDEVFRAWQGMTRPAFHLALAESPSLLSCMARAIVALSNTRSDR